MLTVGAIFQLLHRRVAGRLGNDQVRFAAAMASMSISAVPIKMSELSSKSTPVNMPLERRSGCRPVACGRGSPRRYAKLNQRNGDIQIVYRDNPFRMNRHHHFAVQIVGKRLRRLRRTTANPPATASKTVRAS
jgi:hypothetical protein